MKRGMPIYVFEQNDEEELLSEENNAVKAALSDEVIGQETRKFGADVFEDQSDLEKKVE